MKSGPPVSGAQWPDSGGPRKKDGHARLKGLRLPSQSKGGALVTSHQKAGGKGR